MSRFAAFTFDRRGVSVTVGYVLTLAIASVLIGGLLIAGGGILETQTQQSLDGELEVVGQQVGGGLMSADRLARADDGATTVAVTVQLQRSVSTVGYSITIDGDEDVVRLAPRNHDLEVTVPFATTLDVESTTVRGGTIRIVYDDAAETLEVESP